MRNKPSKELIEWKFGDETAKFTYSDTWDYDTDARIEGLCATSSTGKLFLYSGKKPYDETGEN